MRKLFALAALTVLAAAALFATGTQKTFADQRDFRLVNASRVTITRIFVSPSDTDNWENDVLAGDFVVPGDFTTIHFTRFDDMGECRFDIRADGIDGSRGTLWNVNLCSVDTVTFH